MRRVPLVHKSLFLSTSLVFLFSVSQRIFLSCPSSILDSKYFDAICQIRDNSSMRTIGFVLSASHDGLCVSLVSSPSHFHRDNLSPSSYSICLSLSFSIILALFLRLYRFLFLSSCIFIASFPLPLSRL